MDIEKLARRVEAMAFLEKMGQWDWLKGIGRQLGGAVLKPVASVASTVAPEAGRRLGGVADELSMTDQDRFSAQFNEMRQGAQQAAAKQPGWQVSDPYQNWPRGQIDEPVRPEDQALREMEEYFFRQKLQREAA